MEFRQLEAYVHVYELQSFSKAAERMYVSQPSISAYLAALEKELDTQLIFRSAKEFVPTKAGRAFYQHAKDLLSLRDKGRWQIQEMAGTAGSIDILASSVPAQYILPEILGAFHQIHPDVFFEIQPADTLDVIEALASYKSEIGFVGGKLENPNCEYIPFLSEHLVLITPREERFAALQPSCVLDLIRDEYFVMREAGSGTRLWYEECLEKIGLPVADRKISAQLRDTQSIVQAVAHGLGVSIVSERAVQQDARADRLFSFPIASLPAREFYIVLNKKRIQTAVVESFLAFVTSYFAAEQEKTEPKAPSS